MKEQIKTLLSNYHPNEIPALLKASERDVFMMIHDIYMNDFELTGWHSEQIDDGYIIMSDCDTEYIDHDGEYLWFATKKYADAFIADYLTKGE